LVDFLSGLNQKSEFSPERRAKLSVLILWKFLTDADWDAVNWQLLLSAERKKQIQEIRHKKEGMNTRIANILIALDTPDVKSGITSLGRYYPPIAEPFGFADNFLKPGTLPCQRKNAQQERTVYRHCVDGELRDLPIGS
jgi:hypothetical protein